MSSLSKALVVGLGGVTNGGKTTMCRSLEQLFSSEQYKLNIKSLHLDDYYRSDDDPRHRYLDKFNQPDWDCLDAIDIDRFLADFDRLRFQCDFLFVEGCLIFNIPMSNKNQHRFRLAYYFDLPFEECRKRRTQRDYGSPDPQDYFETHVWQAYIKAKQDAFERNQLEIVDMTKQSFEQIRNKIIEDILKTNEINLEF